MRNFANWPGNYRFGFLCAVTAVIIGIVLLVLAGSGMDFTMGILVAGCGSVLVGIMPQWARNAEEEEQARRRARDARAQLRRR